MARLWMERTEQRLASGRSRLPEGFRQCAGGRTLMAIACRLRESRLLRRGLVGSDAASTSMAIRADSTRVAWSCPPRDGKDLYGMLCDLRWGGIRVPGVRTARRLPRR